MSKKFQINRRKALKQAGFMLGFAVSGPAMTGVLQGCTARKTLDWQPQYLSPQEAAMVEAASARILPSGETPGAADAGVARFIDQMVGEYYLPEDQQRFKEGIQQLNQLSQQHFSIDFAMAQETEQDQLLTELVNIQAQPVSSVPGKQPFFLMLKELTILGFFTSEVGATQFLNFDEVPGSFQGCEPLESVGGKTWAT